MTRSPDALSPGQRGPIDHAIRDKLLSAAYDQFAHYGYDKASVSDLAQTAGWSKAYFYRFFESKQARRGDLRATVRCDLGGSAGTVDAASSAVAGLRQLFASLTAQVFDLCSTESKLHEIAVRAASARWICYKRFEDRIALLIQKILAQGRESGEFERKTPLDVLCRSIFAVMRPYVDPRSLRKATEAHLAEPREVVSLMLRSLAP